MTTTPHDGLAIGGDPPPEPVVPPVRLDFDALPPIRRGSSGGAAWFIALSHLRTKHQDGWFLSLVTVLSILGVLAGVAVLNAVIAVMSGLEIDLRDKILGANAHAVVMRYNGAIPDPNARIAEIEAVPGVVAASPFVYGEVLLRSPWSHAGVVVKGVDPVRTGRVTALVDDLVEGADGQKLADGAARAALMAAMAKPFDPPKRTVPDGVEGAPDGEAPAAEEPLPGLFIGKELREQLQINPGDTVQMIDPLGGGMGLMGVPTPRVKSFRVAGVFDSGMFEYDTKWVYAENGEIGEFFKIGREAATGIEIRVEDIDHVDVVSAAINEKLGYPYYAKHWREHNQALFSALELEKAVMGLILFLIVCNAALMIVTTLIMVVMTKGREIAILKAMGASRAMVLRVFVIEGSVIGLVGTTLGTIVGLAICAFLDWYGWPLDTDVYFLTELPVVVEPLDVLTIAIAAFTVCFLATLYPAWRAASIHPVEGLRYE